MPVQREQLVAYRLEAAAGYQEHNWRASTRRSELLLEQEVIAARTGTARLEVAEEWRSCPQCDASLPLEDRRMMRDPALTAAPDSCRPRPDFRKAIPRLQ